MAFMMVLMVNCVDGSMACDAPPRIPPVDRVADILFVSSLLSIVGPRKSWVSEQRRGKYHAYFLLMRKSYVSLAMCWSTYTSTIRHRTNGTTPSDYDVIT